MAHSGVGEGAGEGITLQANMGGRGQPNAVLRQLASQPLPNGANHSSLHLVSLIAPARASASAMPCPNSLSQA